MGTDVDEVAGGVFRLATTGDDLPLVVHHLFDADEPMLVLSALTPPGAEVAGAVEAVIPLDRLRWVSFPLTTDTVRAATTALLAQHPSLAVVHGTVQAPSIAGWAPRLLAMDDGDRRELGGRVIELIAGPAPGEVMWFEVVTATLLASSSTAGSGLRPRLEVVHPARVLFDGPPPAELRHLADAPIGAVHDARTVSETEESNEA